jgi:hypothetical protein
LTSTVGDRAAAMIASDALLRPPPREPEHEQRCLLGRGRNGCRVGPDKRWLGGNAEGTLDRECGRGEQPTRVTPPKRRIRRRADQANARAESWGSPGGELDGGPIVLEAPEGDDDGTIGIQGLRTAGGEKRDVARTSGKHRAKVVRESRFDRRFVCSDQEEVDRLLGW